MTVQRMIELLEVEHQCMLRNSHGDCDRKCDDCDLVQDDSELHEMYTDAIFMLKEQEAKPVVNIADTVDGIEVGRCPSCDKGIVNNKSNPTRYCKFCGQAVKWE